MSVIKKFLKINEKNKIVCIGDLILDELINVKINRISPEGPLMVMKSGIDQTFTSPGGAANVINQLTNFNLDSLLICWTNDKAKNILNNFNINFCSCNSNICYLPTKKRFFSNEHQIIRHDIETDLCGLNNLLVDKFIKNIIKKIKKMQKPEVVIFSDYNKGFFSSVNFNFLKVYSNVITIVDPKKGPASKWQGCTIFKPNAQEAEEMSGLKDWKDQCDFFIKETNCKACIITREGRGVVGKTENGYFEFLPKKQIIAKNVSGCGDCFVAFLALALARKITIEDCVEVAFSAASIYVQQQIHKPITKQELLAYDDPIAAKKINPEDLAKRNFKLVFCNGCFDILHKQHIELLKFAKNQGDKLVVALNTDASVKRLKGESRPINSLDDRMHMLSMFEFVDYVVSFDEDTPLELLKKAIPDIIVKGSDYQVDQVVGHELAEVRLFPYVDGISTTNILKKAQSLR